jgi:hypothetical protein
MLNDLKKSLWPIIVIGVSLFLLPAIIQILGIDPDDDSILYSILNSSLIQVLGILLTTFSAAVYLIILLKEKRSKEILAKADINDPIWDENSLKYQTRATFYKVQSAFKNHEIAPLLDQATPGFISWFRQILNDKDEDKIAPTYIDITETRIICCKDFLNNEEDKFVGYIGGNIIPVRDDADSPRKEFSEMYHFVRSQNGWLLNKIDGSNLWNLISFSSRYEQKKYSSGN